MDGIAATARLRAVPHPPKVITLTTIDLDEHVYNALSAGPTGSNRVQAALVTRDS